MECDPNLEQNGVVVEYLDDIVVALARAGGSNAAFSDVLAQEMRPYKLAIAADRLTDVTASRILARTYARAIVKRLTGPGCPPAGDVDEITKWLLADPERFADFRAIAEKDEHYVSADGEVVVYG